MKIVDARWEPAVNISVILCDCGHRFFHPVNRWTVRCPHCHKQADLGKLRDEIVPGQMECKEPICPTSSATVAVAKSDAPSVPMSGGWGTEKDASSPRTQSES